MKRIIAIVASVSLAVGSMPTVWANESAADFFRKDKEYWSKGVAVGSTVWAGDLYYAPGKQADVAKMVMDEARKRLGQQHVDDALRLTKLESNFRCNVLGPKTRHGRAVGPLQVLPKSAESLGISVRDLHRDCRSQITAGILHMEKCLHVGANTYRKMAACHVAGWGGWNKRLNRKAEAYRSKYVKMAEASRVPHWAGVLQTW